MFIIYGRNSCVYCRKAKTLLRDKGMGFEYKDVSRDLLASKYIKDVLHAKSVPQIMLDNNGIISHVGGYTQLAQYFKQQDEEEFAESLFDD